MEGEEIVQLPTCGTDSHNGKDEACDLRQDLDEAEVDNKILGENMDAAELEEGQLVSETENIENITVGSIDLHQKVDKAEEDELIVEADTVENAAAQILNVTETVAEMEEKCADMPSENGCVTEKQSSSSFCEADGGSISGVKRMRTMIDERQPSVHVKYHGLSRQSRQKLEELLREWSEWSARNSSVAENNNEESESGEEIYFQALNIGLGKTSVVSFWMENEIKKSQGKDFTPVEDDSVPLYDRGFALGLLSADGSSNLEGGLELLEAPRCFNCGSYSHSLKECPKPRDNATVNNSRRQLKSRRNQTPGMRSVTRYYQDTPGGKYEGLRPGALDADTRRLLGLGEFDPPPWLNRMQEIGYPPGYLEPEDENLPSGIIIYADEELKEEKEEGEIEGETLEAQAVEQPKKMSVKFPGINAPIPKNADERLWLARPSSYSDHYQTGDGCPSQFSESYSRGRYRELNNRNFKDEDSLVSKRARYSSRYNDYDFGYTSRSSRDTASRPISPPNFGSSLGDRARNDPLDSEDSLAYRLYSSYSYSSTSRYSELGNGSDVSRNDHPDYSSSSRDRNDRYRHRSGR